MGRLLLVEERVVEEAIQNLRQRTSKTLVGLLVGQLSETQKDFLFGLLPSPGEDGTTFEALEDQWIQEHARQVTRMLPGGIEVIGVFVFGPLKIARDAPIRLRPLALSIAKAAQVASVEQERYVLHIYSDAKGQCVRTCDPDSRKTDLRPAELKKQRDSPLSGFRCFACDVDVDFRIPLVAAAENETLGDRLKGALRGPLTRIARSLATVDGVLRYPADATVGKLISPKTSPAHWKFEDNFQSLIHRVELFLPAVEASTNSSGDGEVTLHGFVHGRAYVHGRETVAHAVGCLKQDLIQTLFARMDLLLEEIEDTENEDDTHVLFRHGSDVAGAWTLPRRVFVLFSEGMMKMIPLCDHLLPTETYEDVRERFHQLWSLAISGTPDRWCRSLEEFPSSNVCVSRVDGPCENLPTTSNGKPRGSLVFVGVGGAVFSVLMLGAALFMRAQS